MKRKTVMGAKLIKTVVFLSSIVNALVLELNTDEFDVNERNWTNPLDGGLGKLTKEENKSAYHSGINLHKQPRCLNTDMMKTLEEMDKVLKNNDALNKKLSQLLDENLKISQNKDFVNEVGTLISRMEEVILENRKFAETVESLKKEATSAFWSRYYAFIAIILLFVWNSSVSRALKDAKESLQAITATYTKKISSLVAANKSLQANTATYTEKISSLEARNKLLQANTETYTKKISSLEDGNESLQAITATDKEKISSLEAANKSLQANTATYTEKISSLVAANESLQANTALDKEKISSLEATIKIESLQAKLNEPIEPHLVHNDNRELRPCEMEWFPNAEHIL